MKIMIAILLTEIHVANAWPIIVPILIAGKFALYN